MEAIERYHSIPWVAERLDCSTDHVISLIARGRLRGVKIGAQRGIRVSASSLAEFLRLAAQDLDRHIFCADGADEADQGQ
jgi:excisionase family DNA binding protein